LSNFEEFRNRFVEASARIMALTPDSEYVKVCLSYSEKLLTNNVPVIFDLSHLASLVGYSEEYVRGAAYASPLFYRKFKIKKRSGEDREIAEPMPSLKEIQDWIYRNILLRIPVSPAAKAFVPGGSLRSAARFHRGNKFVLRVDIKNFFPSVARSRVFGIFRKLGYSSDISAILSRLCSLDDRLPQGGVCSPYLSNIVLRNLDKRLLRFCQEKKLRYTRYSDDISISGKFFSESIIKSVERVVCEEGFVVNEKKTAVMRSGGRQSVVGIVVNSKLNSPREFRRRIRQQAYFVGKFGLSGHLARIGELRSGAVQHYLGKCSFVLSINSKDRDSLEFVRYLDHEKNCQ
jgi:RNA-directed DNA polymerase